MLEIRSTCRYESSPENLADVRSGTHNFNKFGSEELAKRGDNRDNRVYFSFCSVEIVYRH